MNQNEFNDGLLKEDSFRRICRNKIVNSKDGTVKCHFLHQFDPYLKLGPFKLEELWIRPYRIKIHDFLSNEEIEYFINVSKPYLSDARIIEKPVKKAESNVKTVHKTVQLWLDEIIFKENANYKYIEEEEGFKIYQLLPFKDMNSYSVKDWLLLKLSKRIEMATQTKVLSRFGSSSYQVKAQLLTLFHGN